MASPLDLRQLAVERTAPTGAIGARKRKFWTRYGVPLVVVLGFAAVVGWSLRDRFLPKRAVTVVPIVLTQAEVQQAGTPLFQAAGWIEPRPSAVLVSALVEGIVEELFVVEGQAVEKGQPIAKLVDADARLALADAEASVKLREAELSLARATLTAAKLQFDQPLQLQAALAEAEATLAKLQTEIKNLPFTLRSERSRLLLAQQNLEGKQRAGDNIAVRLLQQAHSEANSAAAAVEQLEQRGPSLQAESSAWERRCDALRTQLSIKADETRKVAESDANVQAADAKLKQAMIAAEMATLRLNRMTVRSPITGRVLALVSKPGRRLMGLSPASEQDSAVIVTLYDPQMLQVRADVRLEDVPQIQPGMPVEITSAALGKPLKGQVLAATSQADIQKNTLQVKVAIHEPPAVIKPDMLVQVSFIAPEQKGKQTEVSQSPLRMLVPSELPETTGSVTVLWIADLTRQVARRQVIRLGPTVANGLVEVVEGVTPLDKLIVSGRGELHDGDRIVVTGEDRTLPAGATTLRSGEKPDVAAQTNR